jgi:hypothetical protein
METASRLIKMLNKDKGTRENIPTTLDGLRQEIRTLESRLDENSKSDIEQIRLIEELVSQNKTLAETLRQALRKVTILTGLALTALAASIAALVLLITG